MSQDVLDPTEEKLESVGTQMPSVGKKKKIKHVCCKHCEGETAHAPHTKGCPPEEDEFKAAVAQALKDQFAVTESWEPKTIVKFVINCPSGQVALIRHLDTMDLVRAHLIEELDFFTKKLFPSGLDAQGNLLEKGQEETIWEMLGDVEKRVRFMQMTNRLMATASVKPKIIDDGWVIITDEEGERQDIPGHLVKDIDEQIKLFGKPVAFLKEGQCYAGTIDFPDRMAFFSELNKPLGLIEPFREGSNAVLASMEPGEIVGGTPQ